MPSPDRSRQSPRGDFLRSGGAPYGRVGARRGLSTLAELATRLRPRDRVIALLLDDHHALTGDQLAAVLFDSSSACTTRLYLLRRYEFVGRIIRAIPGQPSRVCWVPGRLSARLVALARGQTPPTPKTVAQLQDRILATQNAAHLLETNQFFIALLTHARHGGGRLTRWWSERHTHGVFGSRIRPDGHGVWDDGQRSVGFFLEHDRGHMDHTRLRRKLAAYQALRAQGGPHYPVLFSLPTQAREANFHRTLHAAASDPQLAEALAAVPVATCARDLPGFHPAGPVWTLVGPPSRRLALAQLPARHGQPGPLAPGPPTAEQDPLYELRQQPTPEA
jgi:hypothetical protein